MQPTKLSIQSTRNTRNKFNKIVLIEINKTKLYPTMTLQNFTIFYMQPSEGKKYWPAPLDVRIGNKTESFISRMRLPTYELIKTESFISPIRLPTYELIRPFHKATLTLSYLISRGVVNTTVLTWTASDGAPRKN